MNFKLVISFFALVLVSSCQTTPQKPSGTPLPLSPKVFRGELENGLSYYIHPNKKPADKAYVTLLVRAGSLQEEDHERGIAHYVEHMAFNGSEHFEKNELIQALEDLGMQFGSDVNAYTSYDRTAYRLEFSTDKPENWNTIFTVLKDWMAGVSFDPQEVENERLVILSEKRGRKGLSDRLQKAFFPMYFEGSRYLNRIPIGIDETLNSANAEVLNGFYDKWYRPNNMSLIFTGDVEQEVLQQQIDQHFGSLSNSNSTQPKNYAVQKSSKTRYLHFKDQEILTPSLSLNYATDLLNVDSLEALSERLLQQMMVQLFNSRISELMQSPNKPFESAGMSYTGLGDNVLLFSFSLDPGEFEMQSAYEQLLVEIERIKSHGFLDSEIQRYTDRLLQSSELATRRVDETHSAALTSSYVNHFMNGENYISIEQQYEIIKQVIPRLTAQALNQRFKALFSQTPHSIQITTPLDYEVAENFEQYAFNQLQLETSVAAYEEANLETPLMDALPKKGRIINVSEIADVQATRLELSNGMTVILRPSQLSTTEILLSGYAPGGYSLATLEEQRSAIESAKLVASSGIGAYNRTELGKKLANKRVGIRFSSGRYFSTVSGSSTPDDLETLFQLYHLYLTQPKMNETVVKHHKDSVIQYQKKRLQDPENAYGDELGRILNDNHERARPWDVAAAESINGEQALNFYKNRFFNASNFTVVIAGSFNIEEITPYIETYLASLDSGKKEMWVDEHIRTVEKNIEFSSETGLDEKTKVSLRFHKPIEKYSSGSRFRLGFYRELLQQELTEVLREELAGVYSVGVSASIQRYPTTWFNLGVSFNCEPEREQELIAATKKVIERTLQQPLSEHDLENIKQQRLLSNKEAKQNNAYWLNIISRYERDGIDYHFFTSYEKDVEKLTLEQVQQRAKELFKDSYSIESIMRPKPEANEE